MRKLLLVIGLAACGDDAKTPPPADTMQGNTLRCDVAIIGGGAGGVHTAYRLAPSLKAGVCLFEKESVLGGRLRDIAKDDADPASPVFGTGGLRIMEGQTGMFTLASELGITLQGPATEGDFMQARGELAFSKEDLVDKYGITADPGGDTETAFYEALGLQMPRPTITSVADFRTWVTTRVGAEGYAFLRDVSRFRADFEYPVDARSYMDYLDEEWDVCCTPSYPVGGMTSLIKGMATRAVAEGAQIYTNEAATRIERDGAEYKITTSTRTVRAAKVVIAIPPTAFQYVGGDVIDRIKAQPQFKDILPVKVVTITQWWPQRWWGNLTNPDLTAPENNLWRAWSTAHCFNYIEMPLQQYAVDQAVTRSVYVDNLDCVNYWEQLHAAGGDAAVAAEIKRGLELMFNATTQAGGSPVTIPAPLKTYVQVWKDGWHWLRTGTKFTNKQVFDWAVEPLAGENVGLVGEAYNVNRSGWSDAAVKSSIQLLNAKYGLTLPMTGTAPRPAKFKNAPWSLRRN